MNLALTGVGRSGTTWLVQVFKHLHSKGLINFIEGNFHGYHPSSYGGHVVIPIRDLRDVLVSRWRVVLSLEDRYAEVEESSRRIETNG